MSCWKTLTRRKQLPQSPGVQGTVPSGGLGRVLTTFDLTALGVGATLGVGVYVLAGHVSRDLAGPSVVLSFLIAAIASFFAGLCYAEFGARVPKAGSAYYYSYVCIGEIVAFVTGWNMILQYVIGSASISRGLSLYLDTIVNDTLKRTFREIAPIDSLAFSEYFDFLALGLPILIAAALAFGLKKSAIMNNVFTAVNIAIVLFVIICGSLKADISNWRIVPSNATADYNVGNGGFFPFGIEGTIKGAATCFFGFVGFDCIATTGEEVRNPHRALPKAILFSLIIIFLSYFGVSMVLTLMWPYYLQDVNAPLPYVFEHIGWPVAKWIVAIGGVIGLVTSLFGAMFPLPRIIYAMSADGLIFQFLGRVNQSFKTPVVGTLFAGVVTGLVGAIFDLKQLVNMLSIGTLVAYTVVAISIVILRHSESSESGTYQEIHSSTDRIKARNADTVMNQLFRCSQKPSRPTKSSKKIVGFAILFYTIGSLVMALLIVHTRHYLASGELWAIILWSILAAFLALMLILVSMQPQDSQPGKSFKVPLVPLVPAISVFVNIYLMLQLDMYTWLFFTVWLALGIIIYTMSAFILTKPTPVEVVEARNSIKSLAIFETTTETATTNISGGKLTEKQAESKDSFDQIIVAKDEEGEIRVDMQITDDSPEYRRSEERALQLLDSAIEFSPDLITSLPSPDALSTQEIESTIETVVLVHSSPGNDDDEKEEEDGCDNRIDDTDSGILVISQTSLNDPKAIEQVNVVEEYSDNVLETNLEHPKLTHMVGTKTLPLSHGHGLNHENSKGNTLGPVKPSKSETDLRSLLFEEIKRFRRVEDDDEFTDSRRSSGKSPIEAVSPTIPEPPIFDQNKFDQLGGSLPRLTLKIGTLKRKAPTPPNTADVKTPEDLPESTLTKSSPHFETFKNKLEAIYSRGPTPNAFPKKFTPTPVTPSPQIEKSSPDEDLKMAKLSLRPIDTVHRQKLIFNDVLKAINDKNSQDMHNE